MSEPLAPIAAAFARARAEHRAALVTYLTAGHPDRAASAAALAACDAHADVLELGVPFSDPLADGPTIQRSSFEAIRQGMTLAGTLALLREVRPAKPTVIFTYLNPLLRYGLDRFLDDAAAAGAAGLLLTDLPAGGDPALEARIAASGLDLIRLIAPTTGAARLAAATREARGFVYLVSRLGVTGTRAALAADLASLVARVRAATALPVAVGFGVSTAAQVREVARLADGVVVGSALVERLEREGVAGARALLAELQAALPRTEPVAC